MAEGWWAPYAAGLTDWLYSLSKNFTSTAIGLAIQEGKLRLQDKVISFFPDEKPQVMDPHLSALCVRDLLTMSSGHVQDTLFPLLMAKDGDWVKAYFAVPFKYEPGTHLPGHMYANFYSRDSHWQISGLLTAGKFETVKSLLTHLIRYQNAEGSFPTRINLEGKPLYHTGAPDLDSAAFISLSIIEYIRWSKDFAFGESNWKIITASIEYLKSRDKDQDGWIEQEYNEDWADRMKRYGKVNYTQCIWFQLLEEGAALGKLLKKKEAEDYDRMAAMLRENYDRMFWDEESGFYIDYITPGGERMKKLSKNVCLAFIFGLTSDRRKMRSHLQKLKEKCWGLWGPAHHEGYPDGKKYDPLGFYCNGGVWMWLTAFEALAHFRYGDPEDGITALNAIKQYEFGTNPYQAAYFDTTEWHDHRNGLNCEFDWKACRNFTTGSGSHVWSLAAGLFGLQHPMEGKIIWDPRFPESWKGKTIAFNHLRVGNQWNSITFTYSGSWKGESKTEEK